MEVSDVCRCVLSDSRVRLRPSECVWRMSQTDLWSLPPARERQLVARGVLAVLGVSAASHHELLLQRSQTLLQTRLPTVRADSFLHSFIQSFNNQNNKANIYTFLFYFFPTMILWIGYYCLSFILIFNGNWYFDMIICSVLANSDNAIRARMLYYLLGYLFVVVVGFLHVLQKTNTALKYRPRFVICVLKYNKKTTMRFTM